MKKLVLLFAAVVLAGTVAFAVEHQPWEDPAMCNWRYAEGGTGLVACEQLIVDGKSLTQKCCWSNRLCANYSGTLETCESRLENGQPILGANTICCWESRENAANFINAKGNNGKGGKKTPVQAPKNKKGKTTKVQTNTKKVTAKK